MSKKPGLVSVWTMDYREAGEQQQYSTENIGGGDCNNYERFWRHWGLAKTISGDKTLALLVDTLRHMRSTFNFKLDC